MTAKSSDAERAQMAADLRAQERKEEMARKARSFAPGDWEVVWEELETKKAEEAFARLREREAQQRAQDEKVILKRGQEIDRQLRRAEAAEARVAELERLLEKEVRRSSYQGHMRSAKRIKELEEALRGLMDALTVDEDGELLGGLDSWGAPWVAALDALAHEEEK